MVNDDGTVEFRDIGIQRAKTEQTKSIFIEREKIGIDPFKQGYGHSQYDKEAVKLCFQVQCVTDPTLSSSLGFLKRCAWMHSCDSTGYLQHYISCERQGDEHTFSDTQ